jgi:hypothetical protein
MKLVKVNFYFKIRLIIKKIKTRIKITQMKKKTNIYSTFLSLYKMVNLFKISSFFFNFTIF